MVKTVRHPKNGRFQGLPTLWMPVARCFAMTALDLLDHLLNFVAPAFVVGFLCALLGRIAMRQVGKPRAWWAQGAINFVVGIAVLVAGLIVFGHDGMMATYAGLVGRERVIAGADCGFSSSATFVPEVDPKVVWAKFQALAEGARLASERLWRT